MFNSIVLWGLLIAHAVACVVVALGIGRSKRCINWSNMVWIACIPMFGPIAGIVLIDPARKLNPDMEWLRREEEAHRIQFAIRTKAEETVPLEEALLINDPDKRRMLMMTILRSDPKKYLDLLLVARFNEDSETSHYAASTIMELQRQMQLEVQEALLSVQRDGKSMERHEKYITLLLNYCQSGLLEGQFLRRQRLLLRNALINAVKLEENEALLSIQVQNYLIIDQPAEAREVADRMLQKWPLNEIAWLEAMRVAVETRDQSGLKSLLKRMALTPIDWTKSGREQVALWMGGQS